MLRSLNFLDIPAVVHIHSEGLADDFLPSLGHRFLEGLYACMLEDQQVFGYVYEESKTIHGFILGCEDTSRLFRNTLTRRPIFLIGRLAPSLIRKPQLLWKVGQTLLYPSAEPASDIKAELVVVVVDEAVRGTGIGQRLVARLETTFLERGIDAYKVTVNQSNEKANLFYKRLGGELTGAFSLYGKDWNMYCFQPK